MYKLRRLNALLVHFVDNNLSIKKESATSN